MICLSSVGSLIVDKPFEFDDYVRPASLPSMDWTSKFSGGIMVASGMGMINNDDTTSELKLASIRMFSKTQCKKMVNNVFSFPYKGERIDLNV